MKTTLNRTYFLILFSIGLFSLSAQTLRLNQKLSNMTIHGTTNVHNFEIPVTQIVGEIALSGANQVQGLTLTIPVKSLKSKEKLMNNKTHEAFNAETHPNITFRLIEVNALEFNGNDPVATVTGNLTMNGTTKRVTLKSAGKNISNGAYQFKGNVALKMSDFKMKAPTAMMGVMKVGDGVTLKYDVTFEGHQFQSK